VQLYHSYRLLVYSCGTLFGGRTMPIAAASRYGGLMLTEYSF